MNNATGNAVRYEVCVCEIAYNGAQGYPCRTELSGPGARGRALDFARREYAERLSVTSVQVRRLGGRAPGSGVNLLSVRRPYGEAQAPGQYGPFLPVERELERAAARRALALAQTRGLGSALELERIYAA